MQTTGRCTIITHAKALKLNQTLNYPTLDFAPALSRKSSYLLLTWGGGKMHPGKSCRGSTLRSAGFAPSMWLAWSTSSMFMEFCGAGDCGLAPVWERPPEGASLPLGNRGSRILAAALSKAQGGIPCNHSGGTPPTWETHCGACRSNVIGPFVPRGALRLFLNWVVATEADVNSTCVDLGQYQHTHTQTSTSA